MPFFGYTLRYYSFKRPIQVLLWNIKNRFSTTQKRKQQHLWHIYFIPIKDA